jgi:hypothetical protein
MIESEVAMEDQDHPKARDRRVGVTAELPDEWIEAVRAAKVPALNKWKSDLERWTFTGEFTAYVEAISGEMGGELLAAQGAGFFRDAQIAAWFAEHRSATRVHLLETDRPDFEIEVDGTCFQYEATEADVEGRKRGDEYREPTPSGSIFSPEKEWLIPADAEKALRRAATKKANRKYGSTCGLVIFLNPGAFPSHISEIKSLMKSATEPAKDFFADIWVLWMGESQKTWG